MGTPRIQQPPEVQASLEHMRELQLTHNQQRCAVFQSLRWAEITSSYQALYSFL